MGQILSNLSLMHFQTRESITMVKLQVALSELHTMYQEDILNFQEPMLASEKITLVQHMNRLFTELKHLVQSGSLDPYIVDDEEEAFFERQY